MARIKDFSKITNYEWHLPRSYRQEMNAGITIYADEDILTKAIEDESIQQAINAASLPEVAGDVIIMPDVHQGYGFPIGGVAAYNYPDGIISPGAIGYDINCGIRLLNSRLELKDVANKLEELANRIFHNCPSGIGAGGSIILKQDQIKSVCEKGAQWVINEGMGTEIDLELTEEEGAMKGADVGKLSERAKSRGRLQLGTLGSGNHFIEVSQVVEVVNQAAADLMGLRPGCLTVLIHCGSRGLGHQVCTDYVKDFQVVSEKRKYQIPDRELVYAGITSFEGQSYFGAMKCAANYAFANRQVITHLVRKSFIEVFGKNNKDANLNLVYDLAHNIGKYESHLIDGCMKKVIIHRKGATRAFGPETKGVPERYAEIGQPVIVPGSMGTASWVLTGTHKTMDSSLGSLCHGAGRSMSRKQAKKTVVASEMNKNLDSRGVHLRYHSLSGLVEEAPQAYKDVDAVIKVVTEAGLANKVARLIPVVVIKG